MKKKLYYMPWKIMDEVVGDNRKWTNAGIAMTVTGLALTAVGFAMTISSRFVFHIASDARDFVDAMLD